MNRQTKDFTIAFCLLLLFMTSGCVSHAVYHPVRTIRYTPADAKLAYEEISFETKDGVRISGWWVPATEPKGTVLFCHGNGGNISSCMDTLLTANKLMLNVCIFDYRGYGQSNGSPDEQGTYLDAQAALYYLAEEKNIAPEKTIIWGRSLGGPIAARTAAENHAGLLIIESTFTSLIGLVDERFGWVPSWILSSYSYNTSEHLAKVDIPVLVIHSLDDEVVPFHHGKDLFDSIKSKKAFVEIRGAHNRVFVDSLPVYETSIQSFIDQNLPRKEDVLR